MDSHFLNRHKYFLICLIPNIMVLFGYYQNYITKNHGTFPFKRVDVTNPSSAEMKYLVEMPNCKIPDINPLNSDVWPFYQKEDYLPCTNLELLSYIEYNDDGNVLLSVNEEVLPSYGYSTNITCCYMNITRGEEGNEDVDNTIGFSECRNFWPSTNIESNLIKIVCKTESEDVFYSNVHAIIPRVPKNDHAKETDYNVLLVGIDTISQLNFIRTMPKTHRFMEDNDWINLKGYNKIDDNTFPNLMAILTGMNLTEIKERCDPDHEYLDGCETLVWKSFREQGYKTAYAEDEGYVNTFNFLMKGFNATPTDYYFRPYFLGVETLTVVKKYLMSYCTGPETSGERILNLIKDFAMNLSTHKKFGLFWMNTFSHNNINTASSMDDVFENFFEYMTYNHLFDNTIVVFFSDHGFRFGKIRYTYSGWLEERLPFIYVSLPDGFKSKYPKKFENFRRNSNKLTTPYDLHMTLQDVLKISSGGRYKPKRSSGCPGCGSLFDDIDDNRSCDVAGISQHLCTCMGHFYIDPKTKIVTRGVYFALDKLRSIVNSYGEGSRGCADYYVRNVISSGITETFYNANNEPFNYLLIIFETFPKAVFEVTLSASYQNTEPLFTLQGDISRIDRYGNLSYCVSNPVLRKYCYCDGIYTRLKKTVNILFNG